jgi:membrane fusion protein (multidrug efflux system)
VTRKLVIALIVLVVVAGAAYGIYAWSASRRYVTTDDAYVEGTISPVSAKVAGQIAELAVGDNDPVKRGQVLVRLDSRDHQARMAQARAVVGVAEAAVRAARSELPLARESTRADIEQARAAVEANLVAVRAAESGVVEAQARRDARVAAVAAMRADLSSAETARRRTARELERMQRLMKNDYVSRREFEQAEADAETTAAAVEGAQRRLAQTEREAEQAEADLQSRRHAVDQARERVAEVRATVKRAESQLHQVSVKDAEVTRAEARLKEAQADLAFAELQVEYTEVRAPLDGVVSKRSVEVGQVVQPGQPLLAIVPLHAVWVIANFKETQLARVKPGMKAAVQVDGFPDRTFSGLVDSISAGTGSRFSLLPPENATGNWVKVVQRVPVKILLDGREYGNPHTLRAGMSAVVTIRVRE